MANVYQVQNVKESIIRELSGTQSWLMSIENKAPVTILDAEVNIGDANYTVADNATANPIANKTGTAVVADKGVRHTASITTSYNYQPVKYYEDELLRLVRNNVLQREAQKDAIKQIDAVLKAAAATLVDALSDGTLTKTATLADGNTNFAAADQANQAANMLKFSSVLGQVAAYNDGLLPDWVIAHPTAWGNLTGYSNQTTNSVVQTPAGPTAFTIRGIPMWSQPNGTTAKWGAASKPCLLMGSNRHLIFKMNKLMAGEQITFQDSTGLYVLPVGLTYSYGVDFTSTTGLALGVGEVINGVS